MLEHTVTVYHNGEQKSGRESISGLIRLRKTSGSINRFKSIYDCVLSRFVQLAAYGKPILKIKKKMIAKLLSRGLVV